MHRARSIVFLASPNPGEETAGSNRRTASHGLCVEVAPSSTKVVQVFIATKGRIMEHLDRVVVCTSLAAFKEWDGESNPNLEGTDAGHGPYLAACDMPLLSNDAGSGASSTERPFGMGERPIPYRIVASSSRGGAIC